MSRINREFFFEHLHDKLYPRGLNDAQVEGHDAVLDEWEQDHSAEDDRWLAYILATGYHETARTMQPVRETLANSDAEAASRLDRAWASGKLPWVREPYWRKDADGKYWYGRGLVQLTFKRNYATLGRDIGVDLVGDPSLALDMAVAVKILFYGMIHGEFTGKALGAYFDRSKEDWLNARRIVNGLDRASDIAGYAKSYYASISYTV